jgi:D-alanyl-lipoteichoic acid acyltransferase DltB (MBOAT superfamily)
VLFNSYIFIFAFLPCVLLGVYAADRLRGRGAAVGWLAASSLFFYGWWNPAYLALLLVSIAFNFVAGMAVGGRFGWGERRRTAALVSGIAVNLGLLGYFKYAYFAVEQANRFLAEPVVMTPVLLPLAISFFTFQQIAYLCDARTGSAGEYHAVDYCLFVAYFPQLIAGPIVHHAEMMPQFRARPRGPSPMHLAQGTSMFVIGLFKKVVLADALAVYANPVFAAAEAGSSPTLIEAWGGVLAYTGQLYFDFSGYSDMAIGLAWMIGIRLPLNFDAPYRAASIAEFWRRWHITLSRFLRDYLYVPLGGNRAGRIRQGFNLASTLILGGLWHGAGWTFVLWGALHGVYLVVHHLWRQRRGGTPADACGRLRRAGAVALTFVAVAAGWALFRAESVACAVRLWRGMLGLHGVSLSDNLAETLGFLSAWGVAFEDTGSFDTAGLRWIAAAFLIIAFLPTTQQFMGRSDATPARGCAAHIPAWQPTTGHALLTAAMALIACLHLSEISEFLYFQF